MPKDDLHDALPDALSDAALRQQAGGVVFERGEAYAAQGRCTRADDEDESDVASAWTVRGTRRYDVDLLIEAGHLQADCTCPHAADGAFCKHMVAAALAWRALWCSEENLPTRRVDIARAATKSVAKKGARTAADRRQALQAFVHGRSATELAQQLWAWAEQDSGLMGQLKAWQAQAKAADDPMAWKDALNTLLKSSRSFLDWDDCRGYARRGAQALPLLRTLVAQQPVAARAACVHALRRVFKVAEQADDSNGEIGDLMEGIHDLLLQALRQAPPTGADAARWLSDWLALQDENPWGMWGDAPMVEAAGAEVQRRWSERVAADWVAWLAQRPPSETPARVRGGASAAARSPAEPFDEVRSRLRRRCLDDLHRRGDDAGRLDLLRSDLRGVHEHLELAAQLERMGRQREGLQCLEQAAQRFGHHWQLEDALAEAYERDGCLGDLLHIRRRQLERQPDAKRYAAALAAARAAGLDAQAYRAELHRWAEQAEVCTGPGRPLGERNVATRVSWLLHERLPLEALALTRAPKATANRQTWRALATALKPIEPAEAAAILQRLLEVQMDSAQSPYREELALVREWLALLSPDAARQHRARLQAEYRAKRNFVAGLTALPMR